MDGRWVFRGQPIDKPLLPKVARESQLQDLSAREKSMLREFERRIQAFGYHNIKSDWELMSLAQHYGLPTRMLDWSRSALASMWFACRRPQDGFQGDPVVWCLPLDEEDFLNASPKGSPFSVGKTKFFEPAHVSNRISAQDGLFSVHRFSKTSGKFVALDSNPDYFSRLVKIVIPAQTCDRNIVKLATLGAHAASLFPDIYGLAEYLSSKYEFSSKSEEFERRANS